MLDKATLTLGDNRRVDLSQTVIFLTSNLGSSQIADLMHGGMGFIQPKDKSATGLDEKVERTAVEAARRKFSPEFMNRLDKVVVFHPLKRAELDEVLEIELRQVQKRVLDSTTRPFLFRITSEGRRVPPGGGNRPEVWSPPLKARHRAERRLRTLQAAGHRATASGRCIAHRLASWRRRAGFLKRHGKAFFRFKDGFSHPGFGSANDCGSPSLAGVRYSRWK